MEKIKFKIRGKKTELLDWLNPEIGDVYQISGKKYVVTKITGYDVSGTLIGGDSELGLFNIHDMKYHIDRGVIQKYSKNVQNKW